MTIKVRFLYIRNGRLPTDPHEDEQVDDERQDIQVP